MATPMKAGGVAAGAAALSLLLPVPVWADGAAPPPPYHYLHPPPALRSVNMPPQTGERVFRLLRGRTSPELVLFTRDGQAGIVAHQGALAVSGHATAIRITIKPVDPPRGLPRSVVPDGNSYSFTLGSEPSKGSVRLARLVSIVMRWPSQHPHVPIAMYAHTGSGWHRVCDRRTLQLTSSF